MQSGTKIEVIDAAAMKAKWVEVRMADWRKANREPMDPDRLAAHRVVEATAQQHYEKMYGEGEIHAFAYGDTVYVSPELPESAVAHEVMHTKLHPAARDWMFDNNGPEVANQMNESLTEYFNSQLPTGPAQPPTGKPVGAEYTVGRDVLVELRDERLGPDGDQLLRRFYFDGDVKGLNDRLTANNPAGAAEFWNDYRDRLKARAPAPVPPAATVQEAS